MFSVHKTDAIKGGEEAGPDEPQPTKKARTDERVGGVLAQPRTGEVRALVEGVRPDPTIDLSGVKRADSRVLLDMFRTCRRALSAASDLILSDGSSLIVSHIDALIQFRQ